jgi:hypothetical protein
VEGIVAFWYGDWFALVQSRFLSQKHDFVEALSHPTKRASAQDRVNVG